MKSVWCVVPLLAVSVGFAGCASTGQYETRASNVGAPPPQVAAAPVEIEDDGLPAQTPPQLRRHRPEHDDPREPWSPNYGARALGGPAAVPVSDRQAALTTVPQRR